MDLGANEWTTFRKVTLPMIAPGLAAAGLLAFVISLDDFVITNFNAGETSTFPLFIWGAARQGVPPQVNVVATAILVGALLLMALNLRRAAAPGVRRGDSCVVARTRGTRLDRGSCRRCGEGATSAYLRTRIAPHERPGLAADS